MDYKNKTYEELADIRRNSVPGGEDFEQVTKEMEKIQQDTNNKQVANLIGEVANLKNITERSARGADLLAGCAIAIAVLSMISQFLFSIKQDSRCYGTFAEPLWHYSHCYSTFDFGIFGKHTFKMSDYDAPGPEE